MKLAVLFSGGKDSVYAAYLASKNHDIACLISIESKNEESYMFHTPNIHLTSLQAEAMNIPHLVHTTSGEKEIELQDLKDAIVRAQQEYGIKGIVTGAIESIYQAARVQRICHDLRLWCFNPLWKKEQVNYLKELVEAGFEVMIIGIFAYPFDAKWLGKIIDRDAIAQLEYMQKKYAINPSGEGGELETCVLNGPNFAHKIQVKQSEETYDNYSGTYIITDAEVVEK